VAGAEFRDGELLGKPRELRSGRVQSEGYILATGKDRTVVKVEGLRERLRKGGVRSGGDSRNFLQAE